MKKEINLRIAGQAGQGVETLGFALCKIVKKAGFHFFAHQDYMSRIRGGNNFIQLRVAERPVVSFRDHADILVALDKESVALHEKDLSPGGLIVHEKDDGDAAGDGNQVFAAPLKKTAMEKGGSPLYINTAAMGIVSYLLGIAPGIVEQVVRETFSGKGQEVIEKNLAVLSAAYGEAKSHAPKIPQKLTAGEMSDQYFLNGNEAIGLGAIAAGVQFYSAYPMTPSTGIMNTVIGYARRFKIVVEQAEDEIAAINMAIGASATGARAMTGTSGGGFALMCEGLSLAGITETPVVVALAQRPGPATGFPTRTEQGDLNFALHAGHGEFARAIYAPGSVEEAFRLTVRAFTTAEKFQVPVIILTDQYLADALINTPVFSVAGIKPFDGVISKADSPAVKNYKRYALTADGISPRAVPSWIEDPVYVDSDEHTEEGHITESAEVREKMMEKRFFKRRRLLEDDALEPVFHGSKKATSLFVCFGSTCNVLREAVETVSSESIAMVHLPQVWPLPRKKLEKLFPDDRRVFTAENNAGGQLAGLLRRELGIRVEDSILKYNGRPFSLDEMIRELKKRG